LLRPAKPFMTTPQVEPSDQLVLGHSSDPRTLSTAIR
jgi:hypothetical protein